MTDTNAGATASAEGPSLQERYAPQNRCFGCGPANPKGLQIRSFPTDGPDDEVVCTWQPETHHEAFENVLAGGIIGTLLDCHCNWTAIHHLMARRGTDEPPATVTAEYSIKMRHPTPTNLPLTLRAHIVDSTDDRATVEGAIEADGKVTATCRGVFVAVKPGHPAYHRW